MRISTGNLVGACLGAALLAACGGGNNGLSSSTPLSVAPQVAAPLSKLPARLRTERVHVRPAYSVLYSFKGGSEDGEDPLAGLINVKGTLYGTTQNGGVHCTARGGCGTVFTVTTSGGETLLHRFKRKNGAYPSAGLLNVNGTLYGTTTMGGAGYGTVFAITKSAKEPLLYSFPSGEGDGAYPSAGLINVNGRLYGTTQFGGAGYHGTVFAITTSGKERVLYSFPSDQRDGEAPFAGLIDVNGTLYGTTEGGGANDEGTVFAITPSGTETVLHSFKDSSADGEHPRAGLINVNGTLYGTTYAGGANCSSSDYCGTVFAITLSGKETVLHSFPSGSGDGSSPEAGLINIKGTLYGTTEFGGTCSGSIGCGTVFAITTSGGETVLHKFANYPSDGGYPSAGLINIEGTLYGTTAEGDAYDDGTVFSLSP